jgi:hypothetical protein
LRTPQAKSSQDPLVYSTNKHTPVLPSEANPGKTTRPYPKTKAERAGGMAQVQALPSTAKRKKKSIVYYSITVLKTNKPTIKQTISVSLMGNIPSNENLF